VREAYHELSLLLCTSRNTWQIMALTRPRRNLREAWKSPQPVRSTMAVLTNGDKSQGIVNFPSIGCHKIPLYEEAVAIWRPPHRRRIRSLLILQHSAVT